MEKKNLMQRLSSIEIEAMSLKKDKQAHGYKYTTLDQIMEKLMPLLRQAGVALYHETVQEDVNTIRLTTYLVNIDNTEEKISTTNLIDLNITLQSQNKFMVAGSAMTYYRRYQVACLFCLTTEEDNDAGGAGASNKSAKQAGKSIDNSTEEKTTDFIAVFKGLIEKKKPKDTLLKSFDAYKKIMNENQVSTITKLIEDYDTK